MGWCRHINGVRGAAAPNPASVWGSSSTIFDPETAYAAIGDQYEGSNAAAALVAGLPSQLTSFKQSFDQQQLAMKDLAVNTLIYMANADTPMLSPNLASAMALLIAQMKTATVKVTGETVSATSTPGGANVGNAVIAVSTLDHHGVQAQYAFAENITVTPANDAGHGGTAGNEQLSASGTAAAANALDTTWPDGSGISNVTFNVVDFSADNDAGNLLTNSGFELFDTPDLPDQWTATVGVVGTDITEGATVHGGAASLAFVGDAATLVSIKQLFGSGTTGTAGALTAPPLGSQTSVVSSGVYACSVWLYNDVDPAAGVLKIDLIDGANAVINDNAGNPNTITSDLSALVAATWTNVTGFFRLPTTLPASMSIRVRLSTALSVGTITYIDDLALTAAVQLYTGGPYVAAFRGTVDSIIADTYTIAVANNMGSGGGIFTEWFERFFGMRASLGMQLPITGAGATIADSLCQ